MLILEPTKIYQPSYLSINKDVEDNTVSIWHVAPDDKVGPSLPVRPRRAEQPLTASLPRPASDGLLWLFLSRRIKGFTSGTSAPPRCAESGESLRRSLMLALMDAPEPSITNQKTLFASVWRPELK